MGRNDITILGESGQSGAYVLAIRLAAAREIAFGRFRGGRAVALPAGTYAYVGSAMGRGGAAALAGRLLRHATRAGGRPPHAIRPALLREFAAAGLGPAGLGPPAAKRLRWHIDYLLDDPAAEIAQVMVIRAAARIESELARRVAALPGASPPLRGLGASDAPGETHLLRLPDAAVLAEVVALAAVAAQ